MLHCDLFLQEVLTSPNNAYFNKHTTPGKVLSCSYCVMKLRTCKIIDRCVNISEFQYQQHKVIRQWYLYFYTTIFVHNVLLRIVVLILILLNSRFYMLFFEMKVLFSYKKKSVLP